MFFRVKTKTLWGPLPFTNAIRFPNPSSHHDPVLYSRFNKYTVIGRCNSWTASFFCIAFTRYFPRCTTRYTLHGRRGDRASRERCMRCANSLAHVLSLALFRWETISSHFGSSNNREKSARTLRRPSRRCCQGRADAQGNSRRRQRGIRASTIANTSR